MKDKMFFEHIGVDVSECINIEEVLNKSNLNYEVKSENIYLKDLLVIPDKFANVRRDINKIIGIVGKNYNIVQNKDGFSFIQDLFPYGFKFISAGSFNNESGAFIVLEGNSFNVQDEYFKMMLLITNSFDGNGTIKVEFIPIRTLCKTSVVLLEKGISNKVTIKHCSSIKDGILDINKILNPLNKYIKYFKKTVELLRDINIDNFIINIIQEFIPIDNNANNIIKLRTKAIQDELIKLYSSINNTRDNAYKLVLSVAKYESHRLPLRDTNNPQIYMNRVMDGMQFTNEALRFIRRKFL